jgi:hypothetical protein
MAPHPEAVSSATIAAALTISLLEVIVSAVDPCCC